MISWAGGDKMRPAIDESALDEAVRLHKWTVRQFPRRVSAAAQAEWVCGTGLDVSVVAEYRRIVRERRRV